MAILKLVWDAKLVGAQLSVVREDTRPEIRFSLVESAGAVTRRSTFVISAAQALSLARFLAGVSTLDRVPGVDDGEEGDITPTLPGGRKIAPSIEDIPTEGEDP